jgi:hypothetical protein
MTRKILAGFLAASAALVAQAAEVRPLLKAGIDLGGDTIVTATFVDGESRTIRGNEGAYFGGGMAIVSAAKDWEYHLTLAYKFSLIDADNGDIEWTRLPLEALAFYRFARVRIGGGLAYHLNPRLEGSGVVGGLDIRFKNALGAIVQVDWRITENIALGARYTMLEYDAKEPASGSAKSNGLGVAFSINF